MGIDDRRFLMDVFGKRNFKPRVFGGGGGGVFQFAFLKKAASLAGVMLITGVFGAVLPGGVAMAHSPRQHSVKLVVFQPPIAVPDFTLKNLEDKTVRLAEFRGKFVLLNFWATWCPPCVREMPSMQRLAERFKDRPFVVLGISLDAEGASKVKPFIERLGVTFPIALDPESRVSGIYGANQLPATFLIDPLGRVIMAAKGERDWSSEEIVGYLEEVVAASTSGN